jgi:hypothetical protein
MDYDPNSADDRDVFYGPISNGQPFTNATTL